MFIALRVQLVCQVRRSEMFQAMNQSTARDIPLLRSCRNILSSRIYKHFVPTGLIAER